MKIPNADKDEQKLCHSYIADENVKCTAILGNNLTIFYKTIIQSPYNPATALLGTQRNAKLNSHKNDKNVHISIIYENQKLEIAQHSSVGEWLNKRAHACHETQHSNKDDQTLIDTTIWMDLQGM